jgi:PAS domain S-box-containing protein
MAAIQAAQRSFVITDPSLPDNPIIFASKGFLELSGYPLEEILGRNCRFLQGPGTDTAQVEALRKGIAAGEDTSVCFLNYRADGTPFYNQVFVAALRDEDKKIINYVGVQVEIKPPAGDTAVGAPADAVKAKKGRPRSREVKAEVKVEGATTGRRGGATAQAADDGNGGGKPKRAPRRSRSKLNLADDGQEAASSSNASNTTSGANAGLARAQAQAQSELTASLANFQLPISHDIDDVRLGPLPLHLFLLASPRTHAHSSPFFGPSFCSFSSSSTVKATTPTHPTRLEGLDKKILAATRAGNFPECSLLQQSSLDEST